DGFNSDEKGRAVFDGVWANVAGAGRGSFNRRGAQPSRDGHPTFNFFYPSDLFPYTDLPSTDPETGQTDGLLTSAKQVPRIFYTNGSYEYWGRNAALIHISPDGKQDAPLAPNTRVYYVAGSQHGPGRLPPTRTGTANLANINDYRPLYRALLLALDAWIRDGVEPPPSQYPRIDRGELIAFEALRDSEAPLHPMRAWRMNYDSEPPVRGRIFPLLVPAIGPEGNELGGIQRPEVAVPRARYRGWNYIAASNAPRKYINDMVGSTLPLDRSAILKRYRGRESYLQLVREKARQMAAQRLLLPVDVEPVVERAGQVWDWLLSSN
ncbi:MAG: alpha/beta hydrolase domain-containing protein, partial [Acidobacteriota bacterium]